MIVIVFGLPGSGKSFFACRFAAMINADYINSDRVRKKLFVSRTYLIKEKLAVYNEMLAQMKEVVNKIKTWCLMRHSIITISGKNSLTKLKVREVFFLLK